MIVTSPLSLMAMKILGSAITPCGMPSPPVGYAFSASRAPAGATLTASTKPETVSAPPRKPRRLTFSITVRGAGVPDFRSFSR